MFWDADTLLEEREIHMSDYVSSYWDQEGWFLMLCLVHYTTPAIKYCIHLLRAIPA